MFNKVYTNSYSLAKSMMTPFLWLYKFTGILFGYVCVDRSRAQKLLHVYVCLCYEWSWVRFLTMSLEFFIDVILPASQWPGG